MAVVSEHAHLVAMLVFNATQGDGEPFVEQIYSNEPDTMLTASRSFDNLPAFIQFQDQIPVSKGPFPTLGPSSAPNSSSSTQTANKQPLTTSSSSSALSSPSSSSSSSASPCEPLVFTRQAIPATPAVVTSFLTQQMANVPRPPKKIQVKIFLPYGKPLIVSLLENVTAIELIRAAIKQHSDEYRSPPLDNNPTVYNLLAADKDGRPDDDFPALNTSTRVADIGHNFSLVLKNAAGGDGHGDASSSSSGYTMSTMPVSLSSSTGGAGSPTLLTPRARPTLGRTVSTSGVVLIILPDNTKTSLQMTPNLTIGEIVSRVCLRRGLDPSFFYLTEPNEELQLSKESTLASINCEELILRAKPGAPQLTTGDVPLELDRLSYKSFSVHRVPSRTVHRFTSDIASISFDKDRLYLERKKKKNIFGIHEVARVVLGDKPTHFILVFTSGKEMAYTAPSADVAKEIQSRLEFIIAHHKRS